VIGRLRGLVAEKRPPHLLLDVGGVGYELEAPMSTFYRLPPVGEEAVLLTHLVVREDAHQLYGFATAAERDLFRDLIRINGVGAKMALAILSGISVEAFARCVHDGDAAALVRLPGIGRKTAERLIVEMRDRVGRPGEAAEAGAAATGVCAPVPGDPVADAVSALVALGYRPAEATRMVEAVDTKGLASEEIIRRALQAVLRR